MGSDYLTCGQCLKEFPLQKITLFIQHKQFDCDEVNRAQFGDTDLKCYYCPRGFVSAWGLLVHVQVTHSLHIFVEHASISLSTQHNLENFINTFKPTLTQNTFEKENCNEIKECSSSKRILSVKNKDFESRNALNADNLITEAEIDNSFENNYSVKEETMNTKLVSKKSILLSDTDSSLKTTVQGKKEMMQTSNSSYRTSVVDASPIASLSNLTSPILSVKAKLTGIQDLPKPPQLVSDNPVSLISQDKEDGRKQDIVEPRKSTGVADKLSPNDGSCCDNQGCGITVIPGSHQDLQKCCNAVVPKKRKRHMEMKHMPFSWSSSKYARMRMLKRSLVSGSKSKSSYAGLSACGTSTIFIDVEPNTYIDIDKEQASHHQHDINVDIPVMDANIGANKSKNISHGYENRAKSLLLKPGAVFSIPFSYSLPSSVPGTSTSIPISIIQQIAGKKTSNLVTRSKLPINGNKLNDDQIQLERISEAENMGLNEKMIVTDSEVKRRKYPTSKPFQCDTCPMAFNQRIHLKKHTSKHTGIKPYKCDACDYSTVERSHLKVHIRIHTGEKPFKCAYCEYATAQNSTLKIHLKRHHGSTLFACDSSDKLFTQIEQLESHEFDHPNTSINIQKKKRSDAESKLTIDEKEKPSVERDEAGDCETNASLAPVLPNVDTGHVLCISEEL